MSECKHEHTSGRHGYHYCHDCEHTWHDMYPTASEHVVNVHIDVAGLDEEANDKLFNEVCEAIMPPGCNCIACAAWKRRHGFEDFMWIVYSGLGGTNLPPNTTMLTASFGVFAESEADAYACGVDIIVKQMIEPFVSLPEGTTITVTVGNE